MHNCQIGRSRFGKTTLNQLRAELSLSCGRRPVVLTVPAKVNEPGWHKDVYITADRAEFLSVVFSHHNLDVFVEECLETIGKGNDSKVYVPYLGEEKNMVSLASEVAGLGHRTSFNCQYHSMMPPGVRTNITELFLFNTNPDEAKFWYKEFNCPELLKANELPRFYFYHVVNGNMDGGRVICNKMKL